MLSGYNSNSPGRDIAKAVDDFYVRYEVTSDNSAQSKKLAIASPTTITTPQNGSNLKCHIVGVSFLAIASARTLVSC